MKPSVLRLPPQLCEPFQQLVEILDIHTGRDTYEMGGGSILAARWHHRMSTDIDLFFNEVKFPDMPLESIFSAFRACQDAGTVEDLRILPTRGLMGRLGRTPFSFFATRQVTPSRVSAQTIEASGIAAESTTEILCKKMRARMVREPDYLIRDVYDVVVAFVQQPAAIESAFRQLTTEEEEILRFDSQDIRITEDPGIANAAYPELLDPLDNLREFAQRALTQTLDQPRVRQLRSMRKQDV